MPCCGKSSDMTGTLKIGGSAPHFNLPSVDGKNHSLDEFKGSVKGLVVIFSCNHCPYVIASEERMIALGREYKGKGVEFVLISANDVINYPQDSFENMKRRARDKEYPFPYLYNEAQDVARAYGAQVTPHVFLFDRDLKLRYRGAIDDNVNDPAAVKRQYLRDAIEAILSDTPDKVNPVDTKPVGCSVKWK
jgi:peroxiredoxin